MSKVLKTGDVKRYRNNGSWDRQHRWMTVCPISGVTSAHDNRVMARHFKYSWERIARVLSIGPKLVTVRIEK